jgi:hypothetical protein
MPDFKKEFEETIANFDNAIKKFLQRIRDDAMKNHANNLIETLEQFESDTLLKLCNICDPEHEDYEICAAVRDILKKRGNSVC